MPAFCRALLSKTHVSSSLPLLPEIFPQLLLEQGGTAESKLQARQSFLHALPAPVCPLAAPPHRNPGSVGSHHPSCRGFWEEGPSSASEGEWTQAWCLWFPNLSTASYVCFSHFPFMITNTFPHLNTKSSVPIVLIENVIILKMDKRRPPREILSVRNLHLESEQWQLRDSKSSTQRHTGLPIS